MAQLISAEIALGALLESLVNPVLAKMKPFGGVRAAEQDIANQMEAVAWLYNQHLCKELPNLTVLDWEDFCNKASNLQTRLSKFMGAENSVLSRPLTPTEQKVKNACEATKALRVSNNRKDAFVTKICVCLLNFRQDKCVLALGATTTGVWSFVEKKKHALYNENGSCGEIQSMLLDDELAFKAVQEQTGIKADFLQIEERFSINDDLNPAGGSTKFFIMSCTGTFDLSPTVKLEKIAWIPLDVVFSKAHDLLIDSSGSSVHSTPAVQYFHLRPFCTSVEDWLTRQRLSKNLVQHDNPAEEDLSEQIKTNLVMERTGARNEEKPLLVQEQRLSQTKVDEVALNLQLFAPTGDEKSVEDKPRVPKLKDGAIASDMQLVAPTSSLQSLIGRENNQKHAVRKEHKDCIRADVHVANAVRSNFDEEKSLHVHARVDDGHKQSKISTVGLSTNFGLAISNRAEVLASKNGRTLEELPVPAKEQGDCKARQIDHKMALDMNVAAPNRSPQSSTKVTKREEESILDKLGALSSCRTAYRIVKKKRKDLCKELRDHLAQTDLLYKQIAACDSDLAMLIGGGKAGLQLAIQLCKSEEQKQTSSSDVSIDQSQSDALLNCSRMIAASQAETSNKKRPFYMLKSSMQELNEVCTRNKWPLPSYGVFLIKSAKQQCLYTGKVKIRGINFELSESGEARETAKAAKLSAAAYMLSTLHLLKARNAML